MKTDTRWPLLTKGGTWKTKVAMSIFSGLDKLGLQVRNDPKRYQRVTDICMALALLCTNLNMGVCICSTQEVVLCTWQAGSHSTFCP